VIVYLSPPPAVDFGVVSPDSLAIASEFYDRFTANHYATQLEKLAEQFRRAGSAGADREQG
jgi:hypothetical protein